MLTFLRNCQTVFLSGYTILHCYQQWKSSCCSMSLPALDNVNVLDFGHSNRCVVVLLFFSRWDMSDSLQPQGLHTAQQVPLSPTISWHLLKFMSIASVTLSNHLILCHSVSFCLQSFPGPVPMSRLLATGGQSIGASASATVLPMNIQDLISLELTGLISLQSRDSPAPWFESSSSLVLTLYGSALTSV